MHVDGVTSRLGDYPADRGDPDLPISVPRRAVGSGNEPAFGAAALGPSSGNEFVDHTKVHEFGCPIEYVGHCRPHGLQSLPPARVLLAGSSLLLTIKNDESE
jgi:hypothetical protein